MIEDFTSVLDAARASPYPVVPVSWRNTRVWVKKAKPRKSAMMQGLRKILSSLIPVPVLRPSVSPGGGNGLRAEAARMAEFRAAGFRVPDVLFVSDECLILEDLGVIVDTELKVSPGMTSSAIAAIAEECAREISRLHKKGLSHGRCKLNDLVRLKGGGIGFIDFEENPENMPLAARQARELWLFSMSFSKYLPHSPNAVRLALAAYRDAGAGDGVMEELKKFLRVLKPVVAVLSPFARLLGGDAGRAYAGTRELLLLAEEGF